MPLPLSKNQVRNLGKRLRDASTPAPDDLDLLAEVLAAYGEAMGTAGERLIEIGIASSERLKNTGTIIEKLRRDRGTNLTGIQDIAGRRIVLAPREGRAVQDEEVERIVRALGTPEHPPRVFDRRVSPSRGYRAVHLVVEVLDLPVELQVRTALQHEWAEYFERLADVWGRAIRYEDGMPDAEPFLRRASPHEAEALRPAVSAAAGATVDHALSVADLIDTAERAQDRLGEGAEVLDVEVARAVVALRDSVVRLEQMTEQLG